MSEVHVDLWVAAAAAAPVIGLAHSVITGTLYNATARLHSTLGRDNSSWSAEAQNLRTHLRTYSNMSMAGIAASIAAMTWAMLALAFQSVRWLDGTLARVLMIVALAAAMLGTLVLGVLIARAAPEVADCITDGDDKDAPCDEGDQGDELISGLEP